MSTHVFVVSEWLPKEGYEQDLWQRFKELMTLTINNEPGCIRAHVTKQISHPNASGKSKYTIVLLQEYIDLNAFDKHCISDHVGRFKKLIERDETNIIADWQCRLFTENE